MYKWDWTSLVLCFCNSINYCLKTGIAGTTLIAIYIFSKKITLSRGSSITMVFFFSKTPTVAPIEGENCLVTTIFVFLFGYIAFTSIGNSNHHFENRNFSKARAFFQIAVSSEGCNGFLYLLRFLCPILWPNEKR